MKNSVEVLQWRITREREMGEMACTTVLTRWRGFYRWSWNVLAGYVASSRILAGVPPPLSSNGARLLVFLKMSGDIVRTLAACRSNEKEE